jgi:CheY-like chemotaxis protein
VVAIAVSADAAVNIAEIGHPDVVLMDIRLIGPRDGIDAAEEYVSVLGLAAYL